MINILFKRKLPFLFIFLFLIILGVFSYFNTAKESFPDIPIPVINVSVALQGISPEDANKLLLEPIEIKIKKIQGLKEFKSTAQQGSGSIRLEFFSGYDIDKALDDVKDEVDKADLPSEVDDINIEEVRLESVRPVLNVVFSGNIPESGLTMIAEKFEDVISTYPEILKVDIYGDKEEQVEVVLDKDLIEYYNLSLNEIGQMFQSNDVLVAAGTLSNKSAETSLSLSGKIDTLEELYNLPVYKNGDMVKTVGDIAKIQKSYKKPTSLSRLNSESSVTLSIKKRSGENVLETVAKIKAALDVFEKEIPSSVSVTITNDSSDDVKEILRDLQNSVLISVILVFSVILLSLGYKASLLVGLAIPSSFFIGIFLISVFGFSINMVVLFGLIMSVGMLVDGAIVVTEYADKLSARGYNKKEAYKEASRRMFWPIFSSTLTTLAAFVPLIFWEGRIGEFMKYLPITITIVLSVSIFVSLVMLPLLGALVAKNEKGVEKVAAINYDSKGFKVYGAILETLIDYRKTTIFTLILVMVLILKAFPIYGNGVIFFPQQEPESGTILLKSAGNMSLEKKSDIVSQAENLIKDMDAIEFYTTRVLSQGETIGNISMDLLPWDQREKASVLFEKIKEKISTIPGITYEVNAQRGGPASGKPLEFNLINSDWDQLSEDAKKVINALNRSEITENVENDAIIEGFQWEIKYNRSEMQRLGLTVSDVGSALRLITTGVKIGDYIPSYSDSEVDMVLIFPEEKRFIDEVKSLKLKSSEGMVSLKSVIEFVPEPKTTYIKKVDGVEGVTIQADIASGYNFNAVLPELKELIQKELSTSTEFILKGTSEDQQVAMAFLSKAFMASIFIMLIILLFQFNSFGQTFIILSAIVLSSISVFLFLMLTGKTFGIVMSGIGIISLAGIVINNNIVLIDEVNEIYKNTTNSFRESIIIASKERFRPIVLTTITTVIGLMPMLLELNINLFEPDIYFGAPSAQIWSQLAQSIVGGLLFATPMTLLITPVLLMLFPHPKKNVN